MSENCPKCDAEFKYTACDGRNIVYECGRVDRTAGGPTESLECLRRQLAQMEARVLAAEAVAAKLDRTEDGVPIVQGMTLYRIFKYSNGAVMQQITVGSNPGQMNGGWIDPKLGYSTQAAAEAAREEGA